MRYLAVFLVFCGCGSSTTADGPDRYNFGIVGGSNQSSIAGTAALAEPVTAQLKRHPQGEFALVDHFLPKKAYAQLTELPGVPVAGALVCGREALPGAPQVVPLCASTHADGKAIKVVHPGTKAGTYWMVFSADVPSQQQAFVESL